MSQSANLEVVAGFREMRPLSRNVFVVIWTACCYAAGKTETIKVPYAVDRASSQTEQMLIQHME
jgi:hypothetical protein